MSLTRTTLYLLPIAAPSFAYAAPAGSFKELVNDIIIIFNGAIIPLIFAISLVVFLWGVAQYLIFPGSDEKKAKGKQIILWGIISFVVMVTVWGIVNLVARTFFPFDLDAAQQRCIDNPGLWGCYGP